MTASLQDAPGRVVLHVGLPGSGGACLRSVLRANSDALAAAGVRAVEVSDQATAAVLGPDGGTPDVTGAWHDVVVTTGATAEPVRVISADLLGSASDDAARAVVESFAPRRVDVVITARDAARTITAAWQQAIESGRKIAFGEYAAAATGAGNDRPTREQLARHYDVVAITHRWSEVVGSASVHLVTLPSAAPTAELLWQRFAGLLGVPADAAAAMAAPDASLCDGELSFSETELLRRLNRRVAAEFGPENCDRYIRDFLAREVMSPLAAADPRDRPSLDAKGMQWATRRGRQIGADLGKLGVDVVGDLADLVPARTDSAGRAAPAVTYPDSAVRAVAMLTRKLIEVDPDSSPKPTKPAPQPRRGLRTAGRRSTRAGS